MSKKTQNLTSQMEAILVANKIDLSSAVAVALFGLVQTSTIKDKALTKDTKHLISLDDKESMLKVLELSNTVSTYSELENLMIENDIKFQITDKVDSYENNLYTISYCIWFKEYRELSRFSLSKRSSNGVHYESYEAEKNWAEYGKRIKALDDEIIQIKNAVIDEIYTPSEGKERITLIEQDKEVLVNGRKNKVTLSDLDVPYCDTFKHKAAAPQGKIVIDTTDDISTEPLVDTTKPKVSKTKNKAK